MCRLHRPFPPHPSQDTPANTYPYLVQPTLCMQTLQKRPAISHWSNPRAHRLPTRLALCTEQGAHAFAPPGYVKPSARCERCAFCSFPRRCACCGWKSINRARGALEDQKPAWKGRMSLLSLWGKLPWSSVAIWSILRERKFCTHLAVLHKKSPGNAVLTILIPMPTDLKMWFLSWAGTQPQPWLVPLDYSMGSQK